jgi:hypothetical protein
MAAVRTTLERWRGGSTGAELAGYGLCLVVVLIGFFLVLAVSPRVVGQLVIIAGIIGNVLVVSRQGRRRRSEL